MAISQYDVSGIVNRAVNNEFGMPEFQRGFVWTPAKVRDLAESLYRDYPVGALLLWYQPPEDTPAIARSPDAVRSNVWIVDGQQRATALCLLFGRKPYWWKGGSSDWTAALNKFDIHFDPTSPESDGIKFVTPTRVVRNNPNYISVRDLINADDSEMQEIARPLQENNPHINSFKIDRELGRVRDISRTNVSTFTVDKDLEEVVEIFVRLNQTGTKVKEGDITRALVASQNPSWVINTFEPFLDDLESIGFDLEPTLIFRSLTVSATGYTRFKHVKPNFWSMENLAKEWEGIEYAWRRVIDGLNQHGILSSDVLPSKNALIPLITMAYRFKEDFRIKPALSWLIRATCTNRYSRTTDTRLAEDVRAIREANDFDAAVRSAIKNLDALDFTTDANDYFRNGRYRDGSVQLILYLLAYANKAHDWGASNERIGFSGSDLLQKFNPDWHHIFPRAYLKKNLIDAEMDSAANIAAIRKETNLKIGRTAPMKYLEGISNKLLVEQYIPTDRSLFAVEKYEEFLEHRAAALATAANELLTTLESS